MFFLFLEPRNIGRGDNRRGDLLSGGFFSARYSSYQFHSLFCKNNVLTTIVTFEYFFGSYTNTEQCEDSDFFNEHLFHNAFQLFFFEHIQKSSIFPSNQISCHWILHRTTKCYQITWTRLCNYFPSHTIRKKLSTATKYSQNVRYEW